MRQLTFNRKTWLKKDSTQPAISLPVEQKFEFDGGDEIYNAKAFKDLGSHVTVTFDRSIGPFNTWNIYKGHISWIDERQPEKISSSKRKVLSSFPYFSQIDNANNPYGACNVTCVAMCLSYYGLKPKNNWQQFEDELYQYMTYNGLSRHSPYDLQYVVNLYGKKHGITDVFTERAREEDVKASIDKGFPCIVHGYFTSFGHIICIVGYNEEGFVVMDPYGEYWSSGYDVNSRSKPEKGKLLTYSYGMMARLCSPEGPGHMYIHFIQKQGM